jgi:hypothetical protein
MFCPQCKAEYLQGVRRCSDCDVNLVESLPGSQRDPGAELSDADLRTVWVGQDQEEFGAVCAQLNAAKIPFRVNQRGREFLTGLGQYFEIGVPRDSYAQAKEIIHVDGLDPAEETNDPSILELPAEDDEATPAIVDGEWDPEKWFPEDATAEIWSGGTEEQALMIESSLREVNIHARTEITDSGSGKIFVMPNDESRAKEIVREIADAAPPK